MLLTLEGLHTVGRSLDDKTVERAGRGPAWWGGFFFRQDEVFEVNSGDLSTPGLRHHIQQSIVIPLHWGRTS